MYHSNTEYTKKLYQEYKILICLEIILKRIIMFLFYVFVYIPRLQSVYLSKLYINNNNNNT